MMSFSLKPYFDVLKPLLTQPGCPWSKKQTFSSICQFVIEEAYEVLDADHDPKHPKLAEELGDLLFTLSFLMYLAKDHYGIDFDQVVLKGAEKIKGRSPHVFDYKGPITLAELREQWENTKAKEREKLKEDPSRSIATSLPTLNRAMKWVELANKYGYQESLDEEDTGDRLLKLAFEAADQHENIGHLLDMRLKRFENNFREWLQAKKPELFSDTR